MCTETPLRSTEVPLMFAKQQVSRGEIPFMWTEIPLMSAEVRLMFAKEQLSSTEIPLRRTETPLMFAEQQVSWGEIPFMSTEIPQYCERISLICGEIFVFWLKTAFRGPWESGRGFVNRHSSIVIGSFAGYSLAFNFKVFK